MIIGWKGCGNMIFEYTYEESKHIWVTSDTHFGHDNIRKYANRPFDSVEEMDSELISRWNSVVRKEDVVFHLGDFTLAGREAATDYFNQLNGLIIIPHIDWHHDSRWMGKRDDNYYSIYTKSRVVKFTDPEFIIKISDYSTGQFPLSFHCAHYPLAEWDRKHYGYPHLHGHSHGAYVNDDVNCIDVGVDCFDFYPANLQRLINYCW